jgi:hypothetical protein
MFRHEDSLVDQKDTSRSQRSKSATYVAALATLVSLGVPAGETQAAQGLAVRRASAECNKDGCTVVLKVPAHSTVHWESKRAYDTKYNYSPSVRINGEKPDYGKAVGQDNCGARFYGGDVVVGVELCDGAPQKTRKATFDAWVGSVADETVTVRLDLPYGPEIQ